LEKYCIFLVKQTNFISEAVSFAQNSGKKETLTSLLAKKITPNVGKKILSLNGDL
jgi:hypothetical protein